MEDLKPRPCIVKYAVALMVASILIGVLRCILDYDYFASLVPPTMLFTIWGFSFGIPLLITLFIHLGFNWARITMLVLFVIGLLGITTLIQEYQRNTVIGAVVTVQWVMQLVSLILLFTREAPAWFRIRREKAKPAGA